jgi:hypothetical protein
VRYLTVRITNQQRLIANLVTVDSEQRLAQTLLHPAHELGHKERNDPIKGKPDLALCFKPSYLSSLALPTVELLDPRDLCSNPDLHCDIYPLTIGFQARSSHSALPDDTEGAVYCLNTVRCDFDYLLRWKPYSTAPTTSIRRHASEPSNLPCHGSAPVERYERVAAILCAYRTLSLD